MLDVFALIILLVLLATAIGAWLIIAMLPGRIARNRNHPQRDAISVCGWWGALTLGLLTPLAFIWAYTNPQATDAASRLPRASHDKADSEAAQ